MKLSLRHFMQRKKPAKLKADRPAFLLVFWDNIEKNPKKSVRTYMLISLDHEKQMFRFILDSSSKIRPDPVSGDFEQGNMDKAIQLCLKRGKVDPADVMFLDGSRLWQTKVNPYLSYRKSTGQ